MVVIMLAMILIIVSFCACRRDVPNVPDGDEMETITPNEVTDETDETEMANPDVSPNEEQSFTPRVTPDRKVIAKPDVTQDRSSYEVPSPSPSPKEEEVNDTFAPKPKDPVELSAEQENRIKEDWMVFRGYTDYPDRYSIEEIQIDEYYGTYNGCIAVMIYGYGPYDFLGLTVTVAGVEFYYGDGHRIGAWHDGSFYSLDSAYEKGLLTKEDLRNIAYYQNGE